MTDIEEIPEWINPHPYQEAYEQDRKFWNLDFVGSIVLGWIATKPTLPTELAHLMCLVNERVCDALISQPYIQVATSQGFLMYHTDGGQVLNTAPTIARSRLLKTSAVMPLADMSVVADEFVSEIVALYQHEMSEHPNTYIALYLPFALMERVPDPSYPDVVLWGGMTRYGKYHFE